MLHLAVTSLLIRSDSTDKVRLVSDCYRPTDFTRATTVNISPGATMWWKAENELQSLRRFNDSVHCTNKALADIRLRPGVQPTVRNWLIVIAEQNLVGIDEVVYRLLRSRRSEIYMTRHKAAVV